MTDEAHQPTRRLVLLGASNLTRGMATVVETTRSFWSEPLDVVFALGNGRSYGLRTNWLGRGLPSILDCDLWRTLERRPALPTTALITDIGNDILYHVPVPQIAEWVESCVERLQRLGARTVMTALPVCNLSDLSPARFLFFRTLFVPKCRLTLKETVDRATQLNERLTRFAADRNVTVIEHQSAWYGADPIHIRMPHWTKAWHEILSPWIAEHSSKSQPLERAIIGLRMQMLPPAERSLFGAKFHRAQPSARLNDGTTISLF